MSENRNVSRVLIPHSSDIDAYRIICTAVWGNRWQADAARHFNTYPVDIARRIGLTTRDKPISVEEFISLAVEVRSRILHLQSIETNIADFITIKKARDSERILSEQKETKQREEAEKIKENRKLLIPKADTIEKAAIILESSAWTVRELEMQIIVASGRDTARSYVDRPTLLSIADNIVLNKQIHVGGYIAFPDHGDERVYMSESSFRTAARLEPIKAQDETLYAYGYMLAKVHTQVERSFPIDTRRGPFQAFASAAYEEREAEKKRVSESKARTEKSAKEKEAYDRQAEKDRLARLVAQSKN